jgi:hypothetical protein
MRRTLWIAGIVCALGAAGVLAHQPEGPPRGDGDNERFGPPDGDFGFRRHGPPPNPLVEALDTNHDGVISAEEIANAAVSLKKLDENGDGKLTEDELRPHPRMDEARDARRHGPEDFGPDARAEGPPGQPGGPDDGPPDDRGGPGNGPGPGGPGPGGFGPDGQGPGGGGPGGPGGGGQGSGRRGGRRPNGPPTVEGFVAHAMKFDTNGDGKLDKTELTNFAKDFLRHAPRGRGQHRGGPGGGGPGGPGGGPDGGGPGGGPPQGDSNRPERPERPPSE